MSVKQDLDTAIAATMANIHDELDPAITEPSLETASEHLEALAAQADLFPTSLFALPTGKETDRTYLVYAEPDNVFALYVCTSVTGLTYRPHDHGGSWAIIAAVSGAEEHRFHESPSRGVVKEVAASTCRPGSPVSMMPQSIHSIYAIGDTPLVHLHLYGSAFENQSERREFDLETGTEHRFRLESFGFVEDRR